MASKIGPWFSSRKGCSLLVLSALFFGCTQTIAVPKVALTDFQDQPKIPLSVVLQVTDELRDAKSVRKEGRNVFIMPLGGNLAVNAELLAQALFTTVQVGNNGTVDLAGAADPILTPKFISSVRIISGFPVEFEYKIAVVLEWTLTDADGNIIWLDTIIGEGRLTDYVANSAEMTRLLLEAMFSDLFHKSYQALSSSPEIRKFAERKHAKESGTGEKSNF
jgi:hypothetical protein